MRRDLQEAVAEVVEEEEEVETSEEEEEGVVVSEGEDISYNS